MTNTIDQTRLAPARLPGQAGPRTGTSIGRLLLAEWTKLHTLRSTWITAMVTLAASVGLAYLNATTVADRWPNMTEGERGTVDPANTALVGVVLTTILVGTLAARCIAIEYSTGMIDLTFMTAPSRRAAMAAKALLVVIVTVTVAVPANVASYLTGVAVLDSAGIQLGVTTSEGAAAVLSGATAVTAFALIALALGAITRRLVAASITLAVLVLGGQILAAAVPAAMRPYLPSAALEASVSLHAAPGLLSPTAALTVLGLYAALLLTVAARTVRADR